MLETMTTTLKHTLVLPAVLVGMFALGCASAPRGRTEGNAPVRVKDSAAEKVAAHRAASGSLRLEQEEERWGLEAARERRRERGTTRSKADPLPAATAPGAGAGHQIHLATPR
jgi:hypothetical protein